MAVEVLTVDLFADENKGKIKGTDLISGNADDNQIVTVVDGGDLSGNYQFEKWGKGTPTEPGAGPGGDDEFHFDLSGFDDDFSITVKSLDPLDCFVFTGFDSYTTVGNVWTFNYTGTDGLPHTITIDAESTNGTGVAKVVVCFVRGTMIGVPDGQAAIETLNAGDRVVCGDGIAREIRWVGGRELDKTALNARPDLRPIRFAAGSLEPGYPETDLCLSPQHRVLLRDWRAELLFGSSEVLVPAKSLVNDGTIRPDQTCETVEYFHILLDSHQTVFANGVECETLLPAEAAKNALSAEARDEIFNIFPELVADLGQYGPPCQPVLRPFEVRAMMMSGR